MSRGFRRRISSKVIAAPYFVIACMTFSRELGAAGVAAVAGVGPAWLGPRYPRLMLRLNSLVRCWFCRSPP